MKYKSTLFVFCLVLVGRNMTDLRAQENVFLPLNASRIRALGMAAAYQAARNGLGTISYNPASYSLYRESKNFRLTVFFSPLMPIWVSNHSRKFFGRETGKSETVYAAIASVFKAINFTYKNLDFGLLVGEPLFNTKNFFREKKVLHVNALYNNHYDAAILRIKLAEQVAIGASVFLDYFENDGDDRDWSISASYGITMQPNDYLRVGVSLFSTSAKLRDSREFIDEVYNDAIGLGIAFFAPWHMELGFDIRNLTVNQDTQGERFLVGLEQNLWDQVAIRAGIQYHPDDRTITQTFGIGLLNLNAFWGENRKFKHNDFAINYALVRKKILETKYNIHAFSLQIRL